MLDLYLISRFSTLISQSDSTLFEAAKILLVSCGWIGGILFYIKRKEKEQAAKA